MTAKLFAMGSLGETRRLFDFLDGADLFSA
jgi:hypothetical protein